MFGAQSPNHNRFRDLDPDPVPTKKKKNNGVNLTLSSSLSEENIPRYIIATANNGINGNPLSSYNVFQIEKGLRHISTDYTEVKELRSGDLLIKTLNLAAAEKFCKNKYIDLVPVKITMHSTLNSCQGRIYSRKIIDISEEELVECLSEQKVIAVKKIMKKNGENLEATGAAVITFNRINLPDILKLGWERVKVETYIPNPMRCNNCQKLGHTKKYCKNIQSCRECGLTTPHESCVKKFCVNCNTDSHASYDSNCNAFLKYKSVNKIKIEKRCSARDAWKLFNDCPDLYAILPSNKSKPSYSAVVQDKSTPKLSKENFDASTQEKIKTPSKNEKVKQKNENFKNFSNENLSFTILNKMNTENGKLLGSRTVKVNSVQGSSPDEDIFSSDVLMKNQNLRTNKKDNE